MDNQELFNSSPSEVGVVFPKNEIERLDELHSLGVLEAKVSENIKNLVEIVQSLVDWPMVQLSFFDIKNEVVLYSIGLDDELISRDESLGNEVLHLKEGALLEYLNIPEKNKLNSIGFIKRNAILSYVGIPLLSSKGYILGVLSVMNTEEKKLSESQLKMLRSIAKQVMNSFEFERLKLNTLNLQQQLDEVHNVKTMQDKALYRLELATNSAQIGIWEYNLLTGEMIWDTNMFILYDRVQAEFSHDLTSFRDWLSPQDKERVLEALEQFINGVGFFSLRYRIILPSGRRRWVEAEAVIEYDEDCIPIKILGTNRDVSIDEKQKVEMKRLVLASQYTSNLVVIANETGEIEWANDAFSEQVGYFNNEVIGHNAFGFLRLNYKGDIKEVKDRLLGGLGVSITIVKDENTFFNVEIQPMHDDEGAQGFIAIAVDVSERKKNERLKTELLSTVSHELRTPLTSILGAIGLVHSGTLGELEPKAKNVIKIAQENCKRLEALVDDLLDMDKLNVGKIDFNFEILELNHLIKKSIQFNEGYAQKYKVALCFESIEEIDLKIDELRFQQVMSNLLSNAIKFSSANSIVTIEVGKNQNTVWIKVKDRGVGIPEEFKDQIFGKFNQAKNSRMASKAGTGLGLAITQNLVESMFGKIEFESIMGQGTMFKLIFPL